MTVDPVHVMEAYRRDRGTASLMLNVLRPGGNFTYHQV
jgi:hypothetical protein